MFQLETDKRRSTALHAILFLKSLSVIMISFAVKAASNIIVARMCLQYLWLLARSVFLTTKISYLPFPFRKDEESHVAMLFISYISPLA